MKPVFAHVHQLAGRLMRAAVVKLRDGLITSANGAQRVCAEQRVDHPAASATVQIAVGANGGRSEKRKQLRRPHPPEHVDGRAVRRAHDQTGAS